MSEASPRSKRPVTRVAALAVLGALAAFLVPEVWGKPWSAEHFYLRVLAEQVWRSPQLCTSLHLLDWRRERLDDATPRAHRELNALVTRQLATLHRYDRASMNAEGQTTYDVVEWFLQGEAGQETNGAPYVVNQMDGVHVAFPQFMTQQHDIGEKKDAESYVARLRASGVQFDQVIEAARDDAAHGVVPPRFVLARVLADAHDFADRPAADNPLVTNLKKKLADVKGMDDAARADLVSRAQAAIDEVVKPAYARYMAAVTELETKATDDGLWHQPGGEARYAYYLRQGTASDMTAAEVHAMGLAEVAKDEEDMRAVLAKIGASSGSPTDAVRALQTDPRFHYPATPEGRAQIITDYQKILDDIAAKLDRVMTIPFKTPMKVEPIPDYQEASAALAHYDPPPLDESRPGVFAVNLSVPQIKFEMHTLAYHEGMPGHHLQIVAARHQKELPMVRQIVPFNSYSEGWALWAEQIAAETGFEDDPYDRLGYLSSMLFRAARLVVDTGIHAMRWSKEDAVAFYRAHTTASDADVEIEINRYFVWPGQACGYMVGRKTIERLAAKAKGELGAKFSLPAFDDAVLSAGALPMPVLERVIDRWIAATR